MGIETLKGITGESSYQGQSAATSKMVAKSAGTNADESEVASQSVVFSGTDSQNTQVNGYNGEKQQEKQMEESSSIKTTAKDINKLINNNTVAEFGYHEATHKITIKIKDKDTDKVIKEIPSEKALEMLEKAWELAGILFDEKR